MGKLRRALNKPILNKICWVLLSLCLCVFIVVQCVTCSLQQDADLLNSMKDTRLLEYESFAYTVRNIKYLFCVSDQTSFDQAKSLIVMSDTLSDKYLSDSKRTSLKGVKRKAISAEILDLRYEVSDSSAKWYFVKLQASTEGTSCLYLLQLEYEAGVLTSLIIN